MIALHPSLNAVAGKARLRPLQFHHESAIAANRQQRAIRLVHGEVSTH
jgi:hypothetical protein